MVSALGLNRDYNASTLAEKRLLHKIAPTWRGDPGQSWLVLLSFGKVTTIMNKL